MPRLVAMTPESLEVFSWPTPARAGRNFVIADEIATGFGPGKLFACEHAGGSSSLTRAGALSVS
ncbi:aminotransferase, class III domain protein [Enterobacter hormaechei subsp. xiangfangensis]|nr:aminotransferase, class III domain protein [Enterobacter hormaechei subsp. xiangfangensis]